MKSNMIRNAYLAEVMAAGKVKVAIFDMDGLLFDTERLFLDMTVKMEKEIGYRIPRELSMDAIGRSFPDLHRIFAERLGDDFPFETFYVRTKQLVYEHIQREGISVKEGVWDLLSALRERGVELVLASSSPRSIIGENLRAARMEEHFSLIVSGDEVERGKPAPDIFLLAAEKMRVGPEECLVFEDSNNGIRAACAAGMRSVMVPDIRAPEEDVRDMALRVCRTLGDAVHLLDDLLGRSAGPVAYRIAEENNGKVEIKRRG